MKVLKITVLFLVALATTLGLAGLWLYLAYDDELYIPVVDVPVELFIKGGTLFSATSTVPIENPGIRLTGGVIQCVGIQCQPGPEAKIIDAQGLAIVPGLIELHGHFLP